MDIDIEHLRSWIGREESSSELLTPALVERLNATLDRDGPTEHGAEAPLLIHHCLCQTPVPTSALDTDGHARRGGFLPPVTLPRRMWAGGSFAFQSPARVGDMVTRRSTINDVSVKTGRTGTLCFVTVMHVLTSDGRALLTERQDIVYREADAPGKTPKKAPSLAPKGTMYREITASPVLLFRYSALTFNSHRIHFDMPYVTGEEGYSGLVLHGPLQAMLLAQYAQELHGSAPALFDFRSISPVIGGETFTLNASEDGSALKLWTTGPDGALAMEARAQW